MIRALALACVLAGCTSADSDKIADHVDAAPACDACPDALPGDGGADVAIDAPDDGGGLPDGGGGLPINAACEPLLDECEAGLTCRIRAAHDGLCRATGPRMPGAICTTVDQCGPNGACLPAQAGVLRCQIVCAVAAPTRCAIGQTCLAFWSDDTGVCV